MKKLLLLSVAFIFLIEAKAQELPNRYIDEIASTVNVTKDIVFSTNIPTVTTINLFGNRIANEVSYGSVNTTLKMDIYRPSGDQHTQRPVIIFAFGGGFVNGNRAEASMIKLCETFARRGFVTATIDYRLGMNINNPELSKRAVWRALQDGRSAVRYFRKNAAAYGVDANNIYLSGHSAGAFIAYQSVYTDKLSERPAATFEYFGRPDLSGSDEIGDNRFYQNGTRVSGTANGVMGFAGALGQINDIEGASDIPGVYFHSSNDNVVPYAAGTPFSALNWIPGINLPRVYGGSSMNDRANATNAPHEFHPYTNRGHRVHASGSTLYADIAPKGAAFFYNNFLKPNTTSITGSTNACNNCTETYTATNDEAYYYDWEVTGGTFVNRDPYSNTVDVIWDGNASTRNVTVVPYSNQLARGAGASLFKVNDPCNWQQTVGLGTDVGAGRGQVYVVGTNQKLYRYNSNNNWDIMDGVNARRVDVQAGGHPWITATNNRIYRNLGNGWERMRGYAKDIGISGNTVFVVGTNNRLYRYTGNSRDSWDLVRGRNAKAVDAATNGDAWIIGSDDHIYQYQNGNWTAKKGDFRASDITIDEGTNTIWAVELGTGVPHKYLGGNLWESFRGILTSITANDNGEIWGTNSNTNIFKNGCYSNGTNARDTAEAKEAILNEMSFKLFPNPVSSILNLDISTFNNKEVKATFVNMLGQRVQTTVFNKRHEQQVAVDVSNLLNGVYILHLEIEGEKSISKRVVKN